MAGATKVGSEFLVNTSINGDQWEVRSAPLAGGGFVVIWTTQKIVGGVPVNNMDLQGRIYNASGVPIGADFVVSDGADPDFPASVAPSGTGFIVTWAAPFDGVATSVVTRTFNASGSPTTGTLELSGGTNFDHVPTVATNSLGTTLITWFDVNHSASDTSGSAIVGSINSGASFTINTTTLGDQTIPSVAALNNGNFVVTWRSFDTVTGDVDIKAQIVSPAGTLVGGEVTVGDNVFSGESTQVAAQADGGFAIAYFDQFKILGKTYAADGAVLSSYVISDPPLGAYAPAIAGLSNRLIAVSYELFNDFQSMFLKTLAPDGTQVGDAIAFNGHNGNAAPGNFTGQPSITALAGGNFFVGWTDTAEDFESPPQDGIGAIVGQMYSSVAPTFIDGTNADNVFNGASQTGFFLGYGGVDVVTYAGAGAGVTANLSNVTLNTGAAAGDEYGITIEGLTGSSHDDTLTGNAASNLLDGGAGQDTLLGGDDNDVFLVAAAAHHVAGEVIDGGAGTTDRIRFTSAAAGETLVLASGVTNVEIVEITNAAGSAGGTTALNLNASALGYGVTLKGNAGVNTIVGTSFVDVLEGNGGNDTLEGKSGSDIIRGGDGNDVIQIAFAVHHGATEVIDGGAGATDRIRFLSTTAGETLNLTSGVTNVEIIEITNAAGSPGGITALNLNAAALTYGVTLNGNGGVNTITGTGFIDTINGNAGNDVIEGGAGSDILNGGDGNDVFLIASASHHTSAEVIDGGAGTTDRIRFTSTSTGQTLVLSNQVTGVEFIDISTASGSLGGTTQLNVNAAALTAAITINGNAGNNTLTGSAFADTINGNAGNDTINGGAGSDTLDGGAGNDIFRFTNTASASNIDTILNYSVADDRIEMDNTYFTALVDGWLFSNAFTANATGQATSTTQRIIYETDTGALFYDSNGSAGGGTYQQFAQLAAGLAMTAGEFFVI